MRSPEISLAGTALNRFILGLGAYCNDSTVVNGFVSAYSHAIEGDSFRRLLTPVLNNAKSSNPHVRTNAASLFETMIQKTHQNSDVDMAVKELLALPKAGKTAGPDHRVTLYTMLGSVKPSSGVSVAILEIGLPLLAKETHDAAVSALAASISSHLSYCLSEDIPVPPDAVAVLLKEMNSAKPIIRRATCNLVANAFAALRLLERPTAAAEALGHALLPAFETNLKTVASSPLAAPAGPLEGYTAVATLLGRISTSPGFGKPVLVC